MYIPLRTIFPTTESIKEKYRSHFEETFKKGIKTKINLIKNYHTVHS